MAYKKIPLKSADKTVHRYNSIPNLAFCQRAVPTVLTRNADEGMVEHANIRSHSERETVPFSYPKMAHLTPTGKPQTSPNTTAQHPAGESPKRFFNGRAMGEINHSPAPLFTKSSESTIKGKSDGTIARAQSESPSRILLMATSARRKSRAKLKISKNRRQSVPKRGSSAFFLRVACNVILPLSLA